MEKYGLWQTKAEDKEKWRKRLRFLVDENLSGETPEEEEEKKEEEEIVLFWWYSLGSVC